MPPSPAATRTVTRSDSDKSGVYAVRVEIWQFLQVRAKCMRSFMYEAPFGYHGAFMYPDSDDMTT